jgi:hypothetical protein
MHFPSKFLYCYQSFSRIKLSNYFYCELKGFAKFLQLFCLRPITKKNRMKSYIINTLNHIEILKTYALKFDVAFVKFWGNQSVFRVVAKKADFPSIAKRWKGDTIRVKSNCVEGMNNTAECLMRHYAITFTVLAYSTRHNKSKSELPCLISRRKVGLMILKPPNALSKRAFFCVQKSLTWKESYNEYYE